MNDTVLVALIGLLAGVIGSFIAPWAKWGIEKRKLQYQSRKGVVNNVRTFVISKQFGVEQFQRSGLYSQLSDEFSSDVVKKIANPPSQLEGEQIATYREEARKLVLSELNRIEKKWMFI
jgi:hypothetical protein